MKVLVSPNAFKGSLSAREVAKIIISGFSNTVLEATSFPIADGGDGTLEVFLSAYSGKQERATVYSPIGNSVEASWGLSDSETAIIEMANASGLKLLSKSDRDPMITSSFGTGQLVKKAIERGANKILLGIGGSATVDGGMGMLSAMGAKFYDEEGRELGDLVTLKEFYDVDISSCQKILEGVSVTILSDVKNPLLGKSGAAAVFGPQKGANAEMVNRLEARLTFWRDLLSEKVGNDFSNLEGSGAAGGIGYALLSVGNSKIASGFQYLLNQTNLKQLLKECDIVITGEGKIDSQTVSGKAPGEIAKLVKEYGKVCIGICGDVELNKRIESLFDKIFTIVDGNVDVEYAIKNSKELLIKKAQEIEDYLLTLPGRKD